jgi:hypothetical protein
LSLNNRTGGSAESADTPATPKNDPRKTTLGDRGQVALALARARWQHGERRRALGIAAQARPDVAQAVPRDAATLRELTAWLAAHAARD